MPLCGGTKTVQRKLVLLYVHPLALISPNLHIPHSGNAEEENREEKPETDTGRMLTRLFSI